MNEYYKSEYQAYFAELAEYQKMSLSKISKNQMELIVEGFIGKMFGSGFLN
jgi:hypothetical protein